MAYKDPHSPENIAKARAARLKHYYANKEQYYERNRKRTKELTDYVRELKKNPCLDCDKTYPFYVMQFDHVRGEKNKEISKLVRHGSKTKLLEELEKCELVCANCHAERTFGRLTDKSEVV